MITKFYLLTIILFINFLNLFAQEIETYFESQKTAPFQKLYLHIDKEFYFKGDTLWFAAYLVDGKTHKPVNEKCNLYLNLINAQGNILKNEIFPIENGNCPGWLSLSDSTILEGNYILRAFTNYLKNFNDEVFFTKTIQISTIKNSLELKSKSSNTNIPNKIDVSFLPEGGFLLANKINRVAFKAINEFGENVDLNGKLIDEKGKLISSFKTIYKGMGSFYFIPEMNKKYKVEIDEFPDLNIKFPEIRTVGSKLMVGKIANKQISLNIVSSEEKSRATFYIAVLHKGEKLFYLKIANYERLKAIRIKNKVLKNGINRFVLLNSKYEPTSERLIFIEKDEDIQLELTLNKEEYETREQVSIQIQNQLLNSENANFSIAVINENLLNSSGISQNIKSYLLLDSELKGPISNPADYFNDDEKASSKTKLDLLMLTNGWKNYVWNSLKKENCHLKFWPQFGINIEGNVKNKNKFLWNTEVTLIISANNETQLLSTNTNIIGHFSFENTEVYDNAVFFLQSNNYRKAWNTVIELDKKSFELPEINQDLVKPLSQFTNIPISLYRLYYYNQMNLKEFIPGSDTRMIKQVDVKVDKPLNDGHFRMYSSPNYSLQPDESDQIYANMFQYLAGRVPGVKVWGNRIKIRQPPAFTRAANMGFHKDHNDEPLYLLDGFMVDGKTLSFVSISDIYKIEILKGAVAGIFGGLSESGVVSVLTKRIEDYKFEPEEIPGTVYHKIKGFSKYREFYSPKYSPENIHNEMPDYRTTLYWNPNSKLENGQAEVLFFTCDNISRYKIFVEGITESGRICLGSAEFEVGSRK